jgi:hypothetical protein
MRPTIPPQCSLPVQVRVSPDQVKKINEYRRGQEHIPTLPGAIRDLVDRALEALKRSAENTA